MARIDDIRSSDFGSGGSGSEPAFNRGTFAAETCCEHTTEQQSATEFLGEKAERAVEAIGAGMESVGKAIREHAPDHGVLGNAGRAVGDKLEAGGHYVEEQGLKGIGDDVTTAIRKNPVPALCIGFGIGFLAMCMFRR
jgi:hypothetical protein